MSVIGDDKSIKGPDSARLTPVHPDLVAMGLLERVARLKAEGEAKLFPVLTFNAQNAPANAPMTAFTRYLAAREVKARGTGSVGRSEEHTSELQSLMRISSADFCLKKKKMQKENTKK